MNNIAHLPIDLAAFGFVTRETVNGKKVPNRCGRDFLYYALAYYRPDLYSPNNLNHVEIERLGLFGIRMPSWLIWTGLTFLRIPKLLASAGLMLSVNGQAVLSYASLIKGMLAPSKSFDESMREIHSSVDQGVVSGVDVSISLYGVIDHVMFVYGYDADNLYVFDTHISTQMPYEKITPPDDMRHIMRLPKSAVRDSWKIWSRVWIVSKLT